LSGGAFILSDIKGRELPESVNSDVVKKYNAIKKLKF
jgi:hypothetical protein